MAALSEIQVLKDEHVVHRVPLRAAVVRIGRAPSSDLVLGHETVSWHHLAIWAENGRAWVQDLDSSNGTFIGGVRLRGTQAVEDGHVLMLGTEARIRITLGVGEEEQLEHSVLMLEDVDTGVRGLIQGDRVHIGSGDDADLLIDEEADRLATLLVGDEGLSIGTDIGEFPIVLGRVFEIAGRRLRVLQSEGGRTPTVEAGPADRYAYQLVVGLNGVNGPFARLTDARGHPFGVDGDNRAVLLYLLGKQLLGDLAEGVDVHDRGWCSDEDLARGVWGRGVHVPNSLHVLVYRIRKQLKKSGFDPWFIEKRRHAMRVRLLDVVVED